MTTERDWEKVEAAIWPEGPAHGHGSGVYAAHKARVQAEIERLRSELQRREDQIARQAASPELAAAFDAVRTKR